MNQPQRPHHTGGLLLGREVKYAVRLEGQKPQLKRGRIVQEGPWLLVEDEHGHLCWKAPEDVRLITPAHPAGLRPVAYQWGGRTAEYQQGWLIGVYGHPDGTDVLVETQDGQILELDTPSVRFMDRGQGLPASDSVPLALSV